MMNFKIFTYRYFCGCVNMQEVTLRHRELAKKFRNAQDSESDQEVYKEVTAELAHIKKVKYFPIPHVAKMPGSPGSQPPPGNWQNAGESRRPNKDFFDDLFGGKRSPYENFREEARDDARHQKDMNDAKWTEHRKQQEDKLDKARFDELLALLKRGTIFPRMDDFIFSLDGGHEYREMMNYIRKLDNLYTALGLDRETAAYGLFASLVNNGYKITDRDIRLYAQQLGMNHRWEETMRGLFIPEEKTSQPLATGKIYQEPSYGMLGLGHSWFQLYLSFENAGDIFDVGERISPFPDPKSGEPILSIKRKLIHGQENEDKRIRVEYMVQLQTENITKVFDKKYCRMHSTFYCLTLK